MDPPAAPQGPRSDDAALAALDAAQAASGSLGIGQGQGLPAQVDSATPGAGPSQIAPGAEGSSCVLKLKGLPYRASEQEIRDFFEGFEVR